jgi:hypothetical protein
MSFSTANGPNLVETTVTKIWNLAAERWPREYTMIASEGNADKETETSLSMAGFSQFPRKYQGDVVSYEDFKEGFTYTSTQIFYALGYKVTMEMQMFDKQDVVRKMTLELNNSLQETIETLVFQRLNEGFSATNFTYADGLALFSTAHLLEGGGTYKNRPTTFADLSMTSYEQALIDIGGLVGPTGHKKRVTPEDLIVSATSTNVGTAKQILLSTETPQDANTAYNPWQNTTQLKAPHYLTDEGAWFIKTSKNAMDGLEIRWSLRPRFGRDNDFNSKDLKFDAMFGLAIRITDVQSWYGNQGD